ncbi:hypothetical protein NXC24_PC00239 (plasmid) [Rhizobium sp. NXC24]|nr:hypothetical protein NXC24_PC00239 [Rhizobium sp. NXC24]
MQNGIAWPIFRHLGKKFQRAVQAGSNPPLKPPIPTEAPTSVGTNKIVSLQNRPSTSLGR